VRVALGGGNVAEAVLPGGGGVRFVPLERPGLSAVVEEGQERPIQGWIAPSFGAKRPAPCLTYAWADGAASLFAVAVVPERLGLAESVRLRDEPVSDEAGRAVGPQEAVGLVLEGGDRRDRLLVRFAERWRGRAMVVGAETFGPDEVFKGRLS
jgi:hypothetical protein